MEASALTHSSRLGLLARRSPLLKLQGDERLIALIRSGQERAFEALVDRYHVRLLAFCRGMLASAEDAEDVLQEVYVAAHKAILADNRAINARPWLYRIARNRCLNHLRRPAPEGQDSMDIHVHENGASVADKVEKRAEFKALISDVQGLPETQRSALLLREIDALAYEEIAVAMETTVPAVKSLLVRARISLADASQGRHLTCDEVHLGLAEAAEGLRKLDGPARAHVKGCERCREYRSELRRNGKALAALVPVGPLALFGHSLLAKLGLGGAKAGAGSSSAGVGVGTGSAGACGGTTAGGVAAASGGTGAIGIAGGSAAGVGGMALGTKAAAGMASMALLTAGAVEVRHIATSDPAQPSAGIEREVAAVVGDGDKPGPHAALHSANAEPKENEPAAVPAEETTPVAAETEAAPEAPAATTEPKPEPAPAPAPAPQTPPEPAENPGGGNPGGGSGPAPTNPGESSGTMTPGDPPDTGPPVVPPVAPMPDTVPPAHSEPSGYHPAPAP